MEEEYIQNLKNYLVEFDKLPIAKKKITALLEADNCYKKGNIPTKSLPNLEHLCALSYLFHCTLDDLVVTQMNYYVIKETICQYTLGDC